MSINNNRCQVITSTLNKVTAGIEKGTWQCNFNTYSYPKILRWEVKAINRDYSIEFEYEVDDVYGKTLNYLFTINKNQEILYEIRESNRSFDTQELSLIKDCIHLMIKQYTKLVDSLPE